MNLSCNMLTPNIVQSELIEILPQNFISIEYVKSYLRVDHNEDDQILKLFILAGLESCENFTGLSLLSRKVTDELLNQFSRTFVMTYRPVQTILEVNIAGFPYPVEEIVLHKTDGRIILPKSSYNRPVAITYISGYEKSVLIPQSIIQGILIHIAEMYDSGSLKSINQDLEKLYKPYVRYKL